MSKQLDYITPELKQFIEKQAVFFVGTAASDGRVNVSPKGGDSFRVIDKNKVVWLNLTGSGNETAAHLLKKPRMTIMFCAFEGKPLILRLYGNAKSYHPRDEVYQKHIGMFADNVGARQIIEVEIDLAQTSCGYAVPQMEFKEDRRILDDWAEKQGKKKIEAYWEKKNIESIDGFETGILSDSDGY